MSNYSLDFETLALKPNCKVLSLGIAKFNIRTGEIESTKSWKFDLEHQNKRYEDIETKAWWNRQSQEAKEQAFGGTDLLTDMMKYCRLNFEYGKKAMIWGNGANFDVAILDNIFSYKAPWSYWNVRDMRTLVWIAESIGFNKEWVKREGTHHSAIDDAVHQAKIISKAYLHCKGLRAAYDKFKDDK